MMPCENSTMSLHAFERALLSLYSDPRELQAFRESSTSYLEQLELSDLERQALRDMPLDKLARFQEQLHRKSMKVARALLRGHPAVVLMSLHPQSPALVWGNPSRPRTQKLTPGAYEFLHRLARHKQPLSQSALLSGFARSGIGTYRDVFSLARLIYAHRLQGAIVRIPLVL